MRLRALRSQPNPAPVEPAPASPGPTPPWRKLLRVPDVRDLREGFRRNTGLKLFSLLLAFFLWFSINVSERDAERVLELPIVLRRLPADLVVTNPPLKPVAVTMRGPRTILEGVDEQKERIAIDLNGVTTSEPPLELKSEMLRPDLPRRLKVVRFEPARLKLRVERRARRRLPVKVSLDGPPGVGYMLGEPSVTPAQIEVSGPASKVEEQKEITTEPLNVSGITETTERQALLAWAGNFMTFAPDRVMVTIPVKQVMVSRPFDAVPITIRNADGLEARVIPPRVDVTLRGPQLILNSYKVEDGQAWVDAAGLGVGRHEVPIQVDLPEGVELTRRRPETVTLQVMSAEVR